LRGSTSQITIYAVNDAAYLNNSGNK